MGALAGEERPGAALSKTDVGAAVFTLAVAVVVIAAPAEAVGRFDLQDVIDDLEGINDERIVSAADAIADEFQEAGIDDLAGLEVGAFAGLAVADVNHAGLDVGIVEGLAFGGRADTHVVVGDFGKQDAGGGGGPLVEVSFYPVGVVLEEVGEFRELGAADVRGTDEGRDDGGERGR